MRSFRNARQGYLLAMINMGLLLLLFVLALGSTKPDQLVKLALVPKANIMTATSPYVWRGSEDSEKLQRQLVSSLPSVPVIWLAADAPLDDFMQFTKSLSSLGVEKLHIAVLVDDHGSK